MQTLDALGLEGPLLRLQEPEKKTLARQTPNRATINSWKQEAGMDASANAHEGQNDDDGYEEPYLVSRTVITIPAAAHAKEARQNEGVASGSSSAAGLAFPDHCDHCDGSPRMALNQPGHRQEATQSTR